MGYRNRRSLTIQPDVDLVTVYPGERNGIIRPYTATYHIEIRNEERVAVRLPFYNARGGLRRLFNRHPNLPISENPDFVPTEVAVDGKPAIATYLLTIGKISESEVAERLDVTKPTVRQYVGRYKRNG